MEEKTFTWQKIKEQQERITQKKVSIWDQITSLERELAKLELEESQIIEDASENGLVEISVRDFERAAQKIYPQHRPVKVSIRYNSVERKSPLIFKTPEDLRDAKNYEGTLDHRDGQLTLRINNTPRCLLRKCYLPETCEQKENPTIQDLVMCFWPNTVAGSNTLIDIFAQAEKDRAQETNKNLSDGGKQ